MTPPCATASCLVGCVCQALPDVCLIAGGDLAALLWRVQRAASCVLVWVGCCVFVVSCSASSPLFVCLAALFWLSYALCSTALDQEGG